MRDLAQCLNACLVLAAFWLTASVSQQQPCVGFDDPLQCKLNSLVIKLPDSCFAANGKTLCLSDTTISLITLTGVPSEYLPATTLQVGLSGVGASVSAFYSYGKLSGTMTAVVSNTAFLVDVLVTKGGFNNEMPIAANFTDCAFGSIDITVTFSGSGLDALSGLVEKVLTQEIKNLVCINIANFVALNVTNSLQTHLQPKLISLVTQQATPPPTQFKWPTYISWHDSLIGKAHNGIAKLSTSKLASCFQKQHPEVVFPLIVSAANKIIDVATNGTGQIVANLTSSPPLIMSGNATLSLVSLSISGLDTIKSLSVLEPVPTSNVSLTSSFSIDRLATDLVVKFETKNSQGQVVYKELISIKGSVANVTLGVESVLAVNKARLDALYLDQLLSVGCLASTVDEFSISSLVLELSVTQLAVDSIQGDSGVLEGDIVQLLDNFMLLAIKGFSQLTTDIVAGVMQGPVRSALNKAIESSQQRQKATCPQHQQNPLPNPVVVWSQSQLLAKVDAILPSPVAINKFVQCVTDGTGEISLDLSQLPFPFHQPNGPQLTISLAGLSSFFDFALLAPYSEPSLAYTLGNTIGIGNCTSTSSECQPLQIVISSTPSPSSSISSSISSSSSSSSSTQSSSISLSLENLAVSLDLLVKLNLDSFFALQFGQVGVKGCIASSFEAMQISTLNASLTSASVEINKGTERSRTITNGVSFILNFLTNPIKLTELNEQIATQLSQSSEVCANGGVMPSGSGDASPHLPPSWEWQLSLIVVSGIIALGILSASYYFYGRTGTKSRFRAIFGEISFFGAGVGVGNEEEEEEELARNSDLILSKDHPRDAKNVPGWLSFPTEAELSLFRNPRIPLWIRVLLPLCIVANAALFIDSNCSPNAVAVAVTASYGTFTTPQINVFVFTLGGTVQDMWDAKVYPLAVLILFFSGLWPYVKLIALLSAWMLPPRHFSVERRYTCLKTVDTLGKWSLVDFNVECLFLCAFHFVLALGPQLVVTLNVVPKWGFYEFLIATMLSLILGHVELACHRLVCDPKVVAVPNQLAEKASLTQHAFAISEATTSQMSSSVFSVASTTSSSSSSNSEEGVEVTTKHTVRITSFGKIALVFFHVGLIVLLFFGCWLQTFAFSFKGLTGFLLKSSATVDYSLVSIGTQMVEASGLGDESFAIRAMQASFFAFGIAFPLALIVSLFVLWFVPLSISRQRQVFVLAEVFSAWAALDVLALSVVAAVLEVQQFAAFIVGDACDGINVILAEYFDVLLQGDDICFEVIATLLNTSWLLFLAATLCFFFAIPSLSLCEQAIEERMREEERTRSVLHPQSPADTRSSSRNNTANKYSSSSFSTEVTTPLILFPSVDETPATTTTSSSQKACSSFFSSNFFSVLALKALVVLRLVSLS